MARVLFITVPKAGKNLLFSFFRAWGLPRFDPPRDAALQASYASALCDQKGLGTWALPPPSDHGAPHLPVLEDFVRVLAAEPEPYVTSGHFGYVQAFHGQLRAAGIHLVFLYRDPRDILLSMANYLLQRGQPEHLVSSLGGLDREALMERFLEGDSQLLAFEPYLETFAGWRDAEGVLPLRFEELLGPGGGGSLALQKAACTRLVEFLGESGQADRLQAAIAAVYNPRAGTFFRAEIGGFGHLPENCRQTVQTRLAPLLERWGYGAGWRPVSDLHETITFFHDLRRQRDRELTAQQGEHATRSNFQQVLKKLEARITFLSARVSALKSRLGAARARRDAFKSELRRTRRKANRLQSIVIALAVILAIVLAAITIRLLNA
ncbi:MAG: hypothetical protein M3463_15355 [Verrucomicrobiota bacterium]|nr:hypothetical protein [Verrucomicrobiota bacterium]